MQPGGFEAGAAAATPQLKGMQLGMSSEKPDIEILDIDMGFDMDVDMDMDIDADREIERWRER